MTPMKRKTEDNKRSKSRKRLPHTSKSSLRLPRRRRKRRLPPRRRLRPHQMYGIKCILS
jgi:hypothetical protein